MAENRLNPLDIIQFRSDTYIPSITRISLPVRQVSVAIWQEQVSPSTVIIWKEYLFRDFGDIGLLITLVPKVL